jgi:RHS repeat-associated protein
MQDGAHSVVFNALNQPIWMQSAATPPGTLMWVGHDPLGRCVKRWTSASPDPLTNPATYFYYDGWNMIQEGPNAATADRIYAHGNRIDEIVASQAGGAWCYHHFDARGHCILLTNASGGLVEQYDYNAFGKPYFYNGSGTSLPNGSAIGNRFLFTGRELIKDIGIYDFRNRIYEPELARFLQPDPKQFEAGDYNLYRYCHNDPINKSDPFGLKPPEVQYDDPKKQAAVEAQMKTLRSIPAFAEKFKQIDANKINNSVKDAQSRANPALKTPNGLKANATTNGSLLNSLRALFSPSALSSRPVTTYYDPNNGQTQSGRERAPIFGLANEIGEMFQANGVAGSSGGAAAYDNVSIRYENAARSALGAELRPENTNTVLHP